MGTDSGQRKNIAVLFGNRSVEHEISIISALEVISALDVRRYNPIPVYISLTGRWYSGDAVLQKDFYRRLPESASSVDEVCLFPVPGIGGLAKKDRRTKNFSESDIIPVDVYFPVFHGPFGEDGCIQGLFELADVAYVGNGVLAASALMNKYICKSILRDHGVPVLPATVVSKHEFLTNWEKTVARVTAHPGIEKFPLFIKPCNLGSSVGIGQAKDPKELVTALARVFKYDLEAIIEPCVSDMFEINISVIRLPETNEIRASVVEIPVAKSGMLTYEDKYLTGGKKGGSRGMASLVRSVDPEGLEEHYKKGVSAAAIRAYEVLGCSGVSRLDFIVDKTTGNFYFNELNSPPGSLAYYLWSKSRPKLLYTELLDLLIHQAEESYARRATLERSTGFRALFR